MNELVNTIIGVGGERDTAGKESHETPDKTTHNGSTTFRRTFLSSVPVIVGTSPLAERGRAVAHQAARVDSESLLPFDDRLSTRETFTEQRGIAVDGSADGDARIDPSRRTGTMDLYTAAEGEIFGYGAGGYVSAGRLSFGTEWVAPHDGTFTVSADYRYSGDTLQFREPDFAQNAVNKVELHTRLRVQTAGDTYTAEEVELDRVTPALEDLADDGLRDVLQALLSEAIPVPGLDHVLSDELVERDEEYLTEPLSNDASLAVEFSARQGDVCEITHEFIGATAAVSIGGAPVEARLSFDPSIRDVRAADSQPTDGRSPPRSGVGPVEDAVFKIISTEAADLYYVFTVRGDVERTAVTDTVWASKNDALITGIDEDTVIVRGFTGNPGYGDAYTITGELLWFQQTGGTSDYRLELDDTEISPATIGAPSSRDFRPDPPTRSQYVEGYPVEGVLEIVATDAAELHYTLVVRGDVEKTTVSDTVWASQNDTLIRGIDEDTVTVRGFTGNPGYGDAYRIEGDILAVSQVAGTSDFVIRFNGAEVTVHDLLLGEV